MGPVESTPPRFKSESKNIDSSPSQPPYDAAGLATGCGLVSTEIPTKPMFDDSAPSIPTPIPYYNTPTKRHFILRKAHIPRCFRKSTQILMGTSDPTVLASLNDCTPFQSPQLNRKRRRDSFTASPTSTPNRNCVHRPEKCPRLALHQHSLKPDYHRRRCTTPTTPSPAKQEAGSVPHFLTLSEQLGGIASTLTQFREEEETSSQATLTLLKEELRSRREARDQANTELKNISRQLSILIDLELQVRNGTPSRSQIVPGTPGEDD